MYVCVCVARLAAQEELLRGDWRFLARQLPVQVRRPAVPAAGAPKQRAGWRSLKLLWSPVVDAVFWRRFGRRKSWVVPAQTAIGCMLIAFSDTTERFIEQGHVYALTALMFGLVFLVATQDIAVDGALARVPLCVAVSAPGRAQAGPSPCFRPQTARMRPRVR